MSNSTDKMIVEIVNKPEWDGKKWVKVTLTNGSRSFYPSFEDIHRIVRAIAKCEAEKYPNGEKELMPAKFFYDACLTDDFMELANKYNIPIRDANGNVIYNNKNPNQYLIINGKKYEWVFKNGSFVMIEVEEVENNKELPDDYVLVDNYDDVPF